MDSALQQKDSEKQFYFIFVGGNPVFVPTPPPHFVQQSFLVYFFVGHKDWFAEQYVHICRH
jgi:hypothetical protein